MALRKYRPIKKSKVFTILLFIFVGLFVVGYFTNDYRYYLNLPKLENASQKINNQESQSQLERQMILQESTIIKTQEQKREPDISEDELILLKDVPFTSQAPFAEWDDPRQQDGCEEASSLMAVYWARGKALNQKLAKEEILKISEYQESRYGNYIDTSASTTAARIIMGYFGYKNVKIVNGIGSDHIIDELEKGNLVIVPADGQELYNPFYNPPGPERHMLVVKGYDYYKKEFITNDPGTRKGESYRYHKNILYNAIKDYPTGDHETITEKRKVMIVVSK